MTSVERGINNRTEEYRKSASIRRADISIPTEEPAKKRGLFKKKQPPAPPPAPQLTNKYSTDAESSMNMDSLYNHVAVIRHNIKQLEMLREEAEKANRTQLLAKDDDEANRCDDFVEECVQRVYTMSSQCQVTLNSLDAENERLLAAPCSNENEESCRLGYAKIRKDNTKHLRTKLTAQMRAFKAEQEEATVRKQMKFGRQLRLVDPTLTDTQIQKIAADPELSSETIFQLATSKDDATKALAGLQRRCVSMMNIEKSVSKLAMLYQDMYNLTLEQGELLNSTAQHLEEANSFIEKAVEDLEESKERQKTIRKLKCLVI